MIILATRIILTTVLINIVLVALYCTTFHTLSLEELR